MRIYKATNNENGKVYIGQTIRPFEVRKAEHLYGHNGYYFGNALKKYDFDWEIIKECKTTSELNKMERYFIEKYKSNIKEFGYNLRTGGENSKMSKRTRRKMSLAKTGTKFTKKHKENISKSLYIRFKSEDERDKLSKAHMGKTVSEATKDKLRQANLGKKLCEDHKRKIGDANRGKKHSEETKKKIGDSVRCRVVSKETCERMSKTRKVQYNTPMMHKTLSESAKRGWETRRNAEA